MNRPWIFFGILFLVGVLSALATREGVTRHALDKAGMQGSSGRNQDSGGRQHFREELSDSLQIFSEPKMAQPSKAPEKSELKDSLSHTSLEQLLERLPRQKQLQNSDVRDVAHGAPQSIIEAARALGTLARSLENADAMERARAYDFYVRCANDSYVADSVRALCLSRTETLRAFADSHAPVVRVSQHIVKLRSVLE